MSREEHVKDLFDRLDKAAKNGGYNLNPDTEMTLELVEGLYENRERYGYMACPCRLATGVREKDIDIICPCDYRDTDLDEYDACYCGLYVTKQVVSGEKTIGSIPDRRPPGGPEVAHPALENPNQAKEGDAGSEEAVGEFVSDSGRTLTIWRCKVCGYICAREQPPNVCPVCKVDKDRFEKIADLGGGKIKLFV